MADTRHAAFVTARKGICYLTVRIGRRNVHIMRIYHYTIDAQDKRDMRRLHPDVDFDWKKIARQLAGKREACRRYRSRRQTRPSRDRESFYAAYDPITRTIYADGMPSTAGGAAALLDAVLSIDRGRGEVPPTFPGSSTTGQAGARRRPRGRG
jgi:hypothetical protein